MRRTVATFIAALALAAGGFALGGCGGDDADEGGGNGTLREPGYLTTDTGQTQVGQTQEPGGTTGDG